MIESIEIIMRNCFAKPSSACLRSTYRLSPSGMEAITLTRVTNKSIEIKEA